MNEEQIDEIGNKLLEICELLYVLKMALDNDNQPNSDTHPYATQAAAVRTMVLNILEEF